MEAWSDLPVRERFRIKFYLDTQILAYLIDKTYSGLTQTMNYLKQSAFADLVSSKYVIFEFVGIRKREHYLRKVVTQSTSVTTGALNLSSLLKYKNGFEAPGVKFEDVREAIEQKVMEELEDIASNFEIEYDKNLLHNSLLKPTFDITLKTKISREDSLMLVSSVWADASIKDEFVVLMSNDADFVSHCTSEILGEVFVGHNLKKPLVEHLRAMGLNDGQNVNLTNPDDDVRLTEYLPSKLRELIVEKNQQYFLGSTIPCGASQNFPTDVVCFRLKANTPLSQNLYLTIIGKELDFVYSTKLSVSDFWNQHPIPAYPFQADVTTDISFRPLEGNNGTAAPIPSNIVSRLRETGNLVFVNPDGIA